MASFLKSRRTWIGVAAIVVVLGVAALVVSRGGADMKAAEPPANPPLVFGPSDLAYLSAHRLDQALAINGTLDAKIQAVVKAKQAMDIKAIAVREGDTVHTGQVLAQLDTADLEARLGEKISSRDSAKAQFELAEKNRSNNKALLDKNYISQNAFDSADSNYKATRASLEAAEAQVEEARIALKQTTVTAPISGIVAKRYLKVGEKASIDTPLFTIVDLDSLELDALVPAGEVAQLQRGMPAKITVDGLPDQTFDAVLDRVSPATEPGTRSIMVFLTVANAKHILKSGMFAEGTLQVGAGGAVPALPASAVQYDAGEPIVWTIENERLTRHAVEIGRQDRVAGLVEVRAGVPAETPVLASKFDNLKEGQVASIKTAAATLPAPAPTAAAAPKS